MTLLAVGVTPAYFDASLDEFSRHRPGRHAILFAAEGVAIRIQQHLQHGAACLGID